jgi:hypothetical protein
MPFVGRFLRGPQRPAKENATDLLARGARGSGMEVSSGERGSRPCRQVMTGSSRDASCRLHGHHLLSAEALSNASQSTSAPRRCQALDRLGDGSVCRAADEPAAACRNASIKGWGDSVAERICGTNSAATKNGWVGSSKILDSPRDCSSPASTPVVSRPALSNWFREAALRPKLQW